MDREFALHMADPGLIPGLIQVWAQSQEYVLNKGFGCYLPKNEKQKPTNQKYQKELPKLKK